MSRHPSEPQLFAVPDNVVELPPHARPRILTGEALKREGMRTVLSTEDASGQWRQKAMTWVIGLPIGAKLTSETLREAVGDPVRPNAVGAVLHYLNCREVIEHVDWTKADRPKGHRNDLRVWQRVQKDPVR